MLGRTVILAGAACAASSKIIPRLQIAVLHASRHKHWRAPFRPLHCLSGSDRNDLMDPHCKVGLVTEGTTNVGFGAAQELLGQGAETVIITGTHCEKGLEAAAKLCSLHGADRAVFMQADTSCPDQFKDVFKEAVRRFGGVHIMFNNPRLLGGGGGGGGRGGGWAWEHDLHVNLINVLRGCLLAMEYMGRDRGHCGGVVVNNGGVAGLQPYPASPAHCAAQHGVVGATRSFQEYFPRTGVRVVSLCCGQTDGEQVEGGGGDTPRQSTRAAAKAVLHMVRRAPAGSIWVLDSGDLFSTQIPDRIKFSKLVTKYV